jgi:transcriptional regulator with XRE-family HTH domain
MDLELELDDVPGLKNRIKELRERRGLTLEALEARSGIDHSTLSRLENDRVRITTQHLRVLSEALDFHPAEFIVDLADAARTDQERGPSRHGARDEQGRRRGVAGGGEAPAQGGVVVQNPHKRG